MIDCRLSHLEVTDVCTPHGTSRPQYEAWKQKGFDSDPLNRKQMGVTRYRIGRKASEPNHVMIELEFETAEAASRMGEALKKMWVGAQKRGLIGTPSMTAFEIVEAKAI